MVAVLFKVIYGIPLFLLGLFAKGFGTGLKFVAEIIGIIAFKARWYITAIFWTLVLYALVKIEPLVKQYFPQPIWAVYIRFIIVLMGLMLLAFVTKNLRRAFRRARLEVQVLNTMRGAKKHVVNIRRNGNGNSNDDDNGGGGGGDGWLVRLISLLRSRQEVDDTVHIIKVDGKAKIGSYEETLALIAAAENAQVQAGLSGDPFQEKERPDWMKSQRSVRAGKKSSTDAADPLLKAQQLEEEAQALRDQADKGTKRAKRNTKAEEGDDS